MIGRIVILLLAANLAWLAWSQGWLRGAGLEPDTQREPERLQRQIQPEALDVQPAQPLAPPSSPAPSPPPPPSPGTSASAPSPAPVTVVEAPPPDAAPPASPKPAPAPAACLQAGVFEQRQANALRAAAASLPAGSWRLDEVQLPGRWMVYVGKLADADAVAAKRAELRALGVDTDRPGTALEPGLSLGRFSTEEAAERALADLGRKGVRTARVVRERRDVPGYMLRLPKADEALRQRASASLGKAMGGKPWRDCD
ncbi:MAG: SPOR domain-containing protein [Pseudomonadota bacterium]|nr:SPOR domain-containing protein [Pseudomonadota bacterium]